MGVFSDLCDKGLVSDAYAYTFLISGFCKQCNMLEAFRLHEGIDPNIVTYNALIGGLLKSSKIERAKELFGGLSKKGLTLNEVTYATMIDGCCKSRNIDESFILLEEMTSKGVLPDDFVYNALVNGCRKIGNMEKA
ncbi:unnamed protein product [Fraxinus pennsylvanica]|uniref:Pentatricopeptide repeat-containing protein n=1 Tax=Fraxinus pennsylvanica TaxID=56036 RepID=A0AAD1YRK0_9LAMI|nr:unnamed protein product [Fraxinus pennsylvanica]